ncbi:hypothetical protein CAPTEDRAFT_67209, partial [Capitella teleta]
TLLVLLDLSSAFDFINHLLLLERLDLTIRLRGTVLKWIRSYLYGRYQRCTIRSTASKPLLLTTGVPK